MQQQQQQTVQVQQPLVYPQTQPNSVVYIHSTPNYQPRIYNNYSKLQSKCLGIVQVLCGVIAIILNSILLAIAVNDTFGVVGYGIWCGIFFVISGGFGIGASRNPTSCMLVTHMVMSIISACFAPVLLSLGIVGAIIDADDYYCYRYGICDDQAQVAMNSVMAILGLVELVCAIWASAIVCAGMCCNNRAVQGAVIVQPGQQNVTTTVPAGNPIVYQQQYPQGQYTQQTYTYPQPQYIQNTAAMAPAAPQATAPNPPAYSAEPPTYESKE